MHRNNQLALLFAMALSLAVPSCILAIPATAQMGALSGPLRLSATVKPNPPKVGDNVLEVVATDDQGKPVTKLSLAARVTMMNMDMGTTKPAVKEIGDGRYRMTVNLSMAGPWRIALRGQGE